MAEASFTKTPEADAVEGTNTKTCKMPHLKPPSIPRLTPFSLRDMIGKWMPTGYRVVINLPLIGNDIDFLFLIRINPYIADVWNDYDNHVFHMANFPFIKHGLVDTSTTGDIRPVSIVNSPVTITQYDAPPLLSILAASHRHWKGGIAFRIRTVGASTNSGYIVASRLSELPYTLRVFDPLTNCMPVCMNDTSYRESVQNSFESSDLSFYRHIVAEAPYQYPTPMVDQYALLAPTAIDSSGPPNVPAYKPYILEDWMAVGMRGILLNSAQTTGQVMLEVEYRAMDDFSFDTPRVINKASIRSKASTLTSTLRPPIFSMPSPTWISNGLNSYTRRTHFQIDPHWSPPLRSLSRALLEEGLITFEELSTLISIHGSAVSELIQPLTTLTKLSVPDLLKRVRTSFDDDLAENILADLD